MKKILIQISMMPTQKLTIENLFLKDGMQKDFGELLTGFGLLQFINQNEVELEPFVVDHCFSKQEIKDINQNFDAVWFQLDGLLEGQLSVELVDTKKLMDGLTIPYVVVGTSYKMHATDEDAELFQKKTYEIFKQKLKKASTLGLIESNSVGRLRILRRFLGEQVYYLSPFAMFAQKPESDFRKESCLDKNAKVAISCKVNDDAELIRTIFSAAKKYPNYCFLPVSKADYIMLYTGAQGQFVDLNLPEDYPASLLHSVVKNGKEVACVDVASWISYIKGINFYVGTDVRCVMAALSVGTPAVLVSDREENLELAKEYGVPCASIGEELLDLELLYDRCSGDNYYKSWNNAYNNQKKFFKKAEIPLATRVVEKATGQEIQTIRTLLECDMEEQGKRIDAYREYLESQVAKDKKLLIRYKKARKKHND